MPSCALSIHHVRDLELRAIRFSFEQEDLRPPIICVDVNGLEIDEVKPEVARGVAPARWDGVRNLVNRNSPLLEGSAPK
jgi:hypothetical protein